MVNEGAFQYGIDLQGIPKDVPKERLLNQGCYKFLVLKFRNFFLIFKQNFIIFFSFQ